MRIRSIKPEYWRSPDITDLSIEDRLLFIGLWSYVDDNGVGVDDDATIIADLFARDMFRDPRETVARVTRGLSNLSDRGLIVRYTVDGRRFLFVTGWEKHQRIDKPGKPRFPRPDAESAVLATHSRDIRDTLAPGTEEQGNRGTEEQILLAHPEDAPRKPSKQQVSEWFDTFWSAYPVKKGKEPARKAFEKAIREGATLDEILTGLEMYKREIGPVVGGKMLDGKTPKWAQGWLNDKRWLDEPDGPSLDQQWSAALASVDPCAVEHKWTVDGTCARCVARKET